MDRISASKRVNVVALDDDERIVAAIARVLTAAGMHVSTTTNPREAMEMVMREGADAIIADLHMPEMGGHVVLAMLTRAAPNTARILMTNETDFTRIAPLVAPYSVHAFVSKSELITQLIPLLTNLLADKPGGDKLDADARALREALSARSLSATTKRSDVANGRRVVALHRRNDRPRAARSSTSNWARCSTTWGKSG